MDEIIETSLLSNIFKWSSNVIGIGRRILGYLLCPRSINFTSKVTVVSSVIPGKLEFTVPVLGLGTSLSFSSVYLHSV